MPPGKKTQPKKSPTIKPKTDFDTPLVGKTKPEIRKKDLDIKKPQPKKGDKDIGGLGW